MAASAARSKTPGRGGLDHMNVARLAVDINGELHGHRAAHVLRERVLWVVRRGRAQALETGGERRRIRHARTLGRALPAARPAHPSDLRPSGAPGRDPPPRACRPPRGAGTLEKFRGQFVAGVAERGVVRIARLQLREVEDRAVLCRIGQPSVADAIARGLQAALALSLRRLQPRAAQVALKSD